jgi:ABC-type glycerol-3-phosphate transport system permease component
MATLTLKPKAVQSGPRIEWGRIGVYAVLTIGALVAVAPFFYMVTTSLKTYGSVINNNMWPWWPVGAETVQWNNYLRPSKRLAWTSKARSFMQQVQASLNLDPQTQWQLALFFRYAFNSVFVTLATVFGVLATSTLAAYAFAQMDIPFKNYLFLLLLATIMIPGDLTLVPKVVMMFQWKWYNTYLALIVPFLQCIRHLFAPPVLYARFPGVCLMRRWMLAAAAFAVISLRSSYRCPSPRWSRSG